MPHDLEGSFRDAALVLSAAAAEGKCRTLLFTAASAAEGTTTAALGVARQLQASCGLNPLVVELPSERAVLAEMFLLRNEHTVNSVAEGRSLPADCVQQGGGLAMIVSGGPPPADRMAAVRALSRIAGDLGGSYPLILVDAPPVEPGSLTLACGGAAPRAVLVVKAGATSTQTLERVNGLLELHGIGLAGAILNGQRSYMPGWLHRWLSR